MSVDPPRLPPFEWMAHLPRLLAALTVASCAGAIAGREVEPAPFGPKIAKVRTDEVDGLRILWNGPRGGPNDKGAWLATRPEDLNAAWYASGLGARAPVPHVDFARYVVVGFVTRDGPCASEIVRAVSDGRTIELVGIPSRYACEDVSILVAQVVALPRRIVPPRVVVASFGEFGSTKSYAFDVPAASETPGHATAASTATGRPETAAHAIETPDASIGVVAEPPAGHIALEALADGTAVWVAHRADDSLSVLSATNVADDTNLLGVLPWWRDDHRLGGSYDSRGRSVHGLPPLFAFAFRRLEGSRLEVLPRRVDVEDVDDVPIEARDMAPALDGPDTPYLDRPLVSRWNEIPDGHVGRLDASLVFGTAPTPRLCKVLSERDFHGCAPDAPAVVGSFHAAPRSIFFGPVVVRRRGAVADFVVVGPSFGGYAAP
jgi:hypothetical protein